MKRSAIPTASTTAKKRMVSFSMFQQWKRDFDRELRTLSWLECETTYLGGTRMGFKVGVQCL